MSNNQLSYVAKELVVRNNNSMIYSVNLQKNPFKCNCTLQWMLSDLVPQLYSIQPHLLDDLRYITHKIIIRDQFNALNQNNEKYYTNCFIVCLLFLYIT